MCGKSLQKTFPTGRNKKKFIIRRVLTQGTPSGRDNNTFPTNFHHFLLAMLLFYKFIREDCICGSGLVDFETENSIYRFCHFEESAFALDFQRKICNDTPFLSFMLSG